MYAKGWSLLIGLHGVPKKKKSLIGGTVVNAGGTTQHGVTFSSSEAEYVAMAQGPKTTLFTNTVLDLM